MMMNPLLDVFFGRRIAREAERHARELARAPILASRRNASEMLARLRAAPGPKVMLGQTPSGEPVEIPLPELVQSHGLVTGGTGSGKTMACLLILSGLLEAAETYAAGFAVVDGAKSDLFLGALCLIRRKLEALAKRDPDAAAKFRRRVRIIDFAAEEALSPCNILARWPNAEPDSFASHQVDLLLDLLPDSNALKLAAAPLKSLVQIGRRSACRSQSSSRFSTTTRSSTA